VNHDERTACKAAKAAAHSSVSERLHEALTALQASDYKAVGVAMRSGASYAVKARKAHEALDGNA
jgi:hypothetical protein